MSLVSLAEERLLTVDRFPDSAFKISALLLMLLDDGSWLVVPVMLGLLLRVTDEFKMVIVIMMEK
jgi:hypothetical protein